MPTLNPSLELLSASADYTADDWGHFGAQGSLDIRPTIELNRGFDLELDAEALIQIDASLRKFAAIDVDGFATASAGVRAQLQTPIDLFGECGVALRLQAQAQAAAGVQVRLSLVVADLLALVDADPHLKGTPARLIRVLLEETSPGGGVLAKAAVAAMAYVNVSATGSFLPQGATPPGFTVAAEYGAGWGAGYGIKGFVSFGVDDPRNLIRRSVDVAVDGTTDDLAALFGDDAAAGRLIAELRAPLKIALRTMFEVGLELATHAGSFSPDAGQTLCLRAVQTALEEAQRLILERAIQWAAAEARRALGGLAFTQAQWDAAAADRASLATLLQTFPSDPFEATDSNRTYWRDVVTLASNVFGGLGGQTSPDDPGVAALATIYAATQLLFIAIERISNGQARASVIGVRPAVTATAFEGDVAAPSPLVKRHINQTLGHDPAAAITQTSLVTYLIEGRVLPLVAGMAPELDALASIFAGEAPGAIGAGFSTILSNIGAFTPDGRGGVDPRASLIAILQGLKAYADARINGELLPLLDAQSANASPEVRTYLDEVLLSSLNFCIDSVFARLIDWANGSTSGQTALQEGCSAVLMRLFGRSLIVTTDAVLARLMAGISTAYADVAHHLNDPGGIADKLEDLPQLGTLTPADLAELLGEQFLVMAHVARPLDPEQRARIRDLLYRLIDTAPPSPDDEFVEQLATDLGVRNLEAGKDLALEFGALWVSRFVDFVGAWLEHVGERILEEIQQAVEAIVAGVQAFIDELEALARDLARRAEELVVEIGRLTRALDERLDAALDAAARLAARLGATGQARTALRGALKDAAVSRCMSVLADVPGYSLVPSWAIGQVHSALRSAVGAVLNDAVLDVVLDALDAPAMAAADLLRDLRDIEPGDDLTEAVLNLFLDRLEDAIRAAFGGSGPRLDLRLRFTAHGSVSTPVGRASVSFDVDLDLGRVRIPLGHIIDAVRSAARGLDLLVQTAEEVAQAVLKQIEAEGDLAAAQAEQTVTSDARTEATTALDETRPAALDAIIVSPAHSSVVEGSVVMEIHVTGAPRSYLGLESSQIQRIHVWINGAEVPIASFACRDLGGGLTVGTIPAPDSPLRRPLHPRATSRSAIRSAPAPAPVRLGRPNRLGDRLALDAQHAYPGLSLSLRLTPGMLAEGINTIAVAVVDRRDGHRVVRTSAFVALPPEEVLKPRPPKIKRRKIPAPPRPVFPVADLPASVRDRLVRTFGASMPTAAAGAAKPLQPAPRLGRTWMAAAAQRQAAWKAEARRVEGTLGQARAPVEALRKATTTRALRPVVAAPPKLERPDVPTRSQEPR